MMKQLSKDHGLINYLISPISVLISENFKLRIVDFSVVDFYTEDNGGEDSDASEQTI